MRTTRIGNTSIPILAMACVTLSYALMCEDPIAARARTIKPDVLASASAIWAGVPVLMTHWANDSEHHYDKWTSCHSLFLSLVDGCQEAGVTEPSF